MKTLLVDLLERIYLCPNEMSPSAYDTAWLAWLYPEARAWLLEAQLPDGSWGAEIEYFHDRIIATLAAINAIAATSTNSHDLKRIDAGICYLERALPQLSDQQMETVGFELILPSLVKMGQDLGLKLDCIAALTASQLPKYHQKLSLISERLIYSPDTVLPHNLEFIGFERVAASAVAGLRSANGSIHNSPSATAFVEVALGRSDAGSGYLRSIMRRYENTSPALAPMEIFELVWSLYHIGRHHPLNLFGPTMNRLIEQLKSAWTPQGIGLAKDFVADPDDTSVSFFILSQFDTHPNPKIFHFYEEADHFRCYPFERNISLDVHIHIVDALKAVPHFPGRDEMLLKALNILGRYLTDDYILDKWHISPYYSTSHAVMGLTGLSDPIIVKQIEWLLRTQRADGSWTFFPNHPQAAIEETAYVLMALMTLYERRGDIPFTRIDKGFRFLERHYHSVRDLPALWIHKVLYTPYHIVEAVILSAMAKYHELRHHL